MRRWEWNDGGRSEQKETKGSDAGTEIRAVLRIRRDHRDRRVHPDGGGDGLPVLAMLSDGADLLRPLELHDEPPLHLPVGEQRAGGDDESRRLLLRLHPGHDHRGQLLGGDTWLECFSGDGPQYGMQYRDGIPVPEILRVRQNDRYEQTGAKDRGKRSREKSRYDGTGVNHAYLRTRISTRNGDRHEADAGL